MTRRAKSHQPVLPLRPHPLRDQILDVMRSYGQPISPRRLSEPGIVDCTVNLLLNILMERPLSNELSELEERVSSRDVATHTVESRPITLTGDLLPLTPHEDSMLAVDVGDVVLGFPIAIRGALERQYGPSISERELNLIQAGAELAVEALAQVIRVTEGTWDPQTNSVTPPTRPSSPD